MVSPVTLRNVGVTALVSALALTTADGAMTRALIAEVADAAVARLETEAALSAAALRAGGDPATERDILGTWAAWYRDALATFDDLEVGGTQPATRAAIAAAQAGGRRRAQAGSRRGSAGL
jgi:aminopeptidase YwaD